MRCKGENENSSFCQQEHAQLQSNSRFKEICKQLQILSREDPTLVYHSQHDVKLANSLMFQEMVPVQSLENQVLLLLFSCPPPLLFLLLLQKSNPNKSPLSTNGLILPI